jgi:hypothetical protein
VAVDYPLVAVEHAVVRSPVGSAPETSGSVIEKNERAVPSTSGFRKRSFCSSGAEHVQDLAVALRRAPGS